jgi:hypothetical protein
MNRSLLILTLATLTGCSGVKKPFEGRHDPYPAGQVHFASQYLQDVTAVGRPVATRDDTGGILYITVPIRSTTNEPISIDYRVTFLDRNGQMISQSGWFTRPLTPNIPDTITVNSNGPRAADFQIDFRQAK